MESSPKDKPLSGLRVLLTRPAGQVRPLKDTIISLGGTPIVFPTIEIVPLALGPTDEKAIKEADLCILTSVNAAQTCSSVAENKRGMAIGESTAKAMQAQGWRLEHTPTPGSTSESLLAAACLQEIKGQRITVIGGRHPRQALHAGLRQRGAQVKHVAAYERQCPSLRPNIAQWEAVDVVVSTSLDSVRHLVHLLGPKDCQWLATVPVCVPSDRIARVLHALPFVCEVIQAPGAHDKAIVDCLTDWWKKN